MGDDETCSIVGRGDVQIQTNGFKWYLKDVRHVPQLQRNLVLVGQLGAASYTSTFIVDAWKVSNGTMVVVRGKKNGTLYLTSHATDTLVFANDRVGLDLWHNRLGHMSEKGMTVLQS